MQLFDLVEAVDQFFADTQTLPELSLELQPVTRRYGGASQLVLKQAVPATIGVSSLAVAAIAFSLIPAPQIRVPEPKPEEQTNSNTPTTNPTPASTTTPIAAATPTATAVTIPEATPTATPAATTQPTVKDLEALLNTVTEITDPSQLRALNRQVWNQIEPAWNSRSAVKENLIYRVGVAADGAIVGYKAVNQGANAGIELTPLPNLLYNPANRPPIANEPIAQFKVVFTNNGVLEVSPWRGYVRTPEVIGAKITDTNTVKDLNQRLFDTVRQNWSGKPTFTKDLKYRVAVTKEGTIADYEPLNQVAFDYFRETPLPRMFQAVYGSNAAAPNNKEPLAHYQVVFQPSGKLEVTPWQGYR
ncbi:all4580 [Nostoc sp. PCC 7120 = FACHB-418]|nr:all4580 [Nostoc sp. PCC 7120 = FACHB-418]